MEQFPKEFFRKFKGIEENLVMFLDKESQLGNFALFNQYFENQNLPENKHEVKSFLYLIVAISNYYHRSENFFNKIEMILKQIHIKQLFSNFEIFHIFQNSKRLLLFLFKIGIITLNEEIYLNILKNKKYLERKYLEYFFPEFEMYFNDNEKKRIHQILNQSNIDDFEKKREIGENDNYICELIRKDQIKDFVTYLNQKNISPSIRIQPSIFETNLFLINKNPTLIEYAAFYGSIQIFKYLHIQNAKLETSIWSYAIHGRNAEIIYFLEEQKIKTLCNSYQYLIIESIKCHHNELALYFMNHICENEQIFCNYLYEKCLKYYNFVFFADEIMNSLNNTNKNIEKSNIPFYLCKYDYFLVVDILTKADIIDINYQYTIYKPLPDQKENIVLYIKIKNGDADQKTEEEKMNEKEYPYYRYRNENEKFSQFSIETSTNLDIAIRKRNIDIAQLLLNFNTIDLSFKSTKKYKKNKESAQHNYGYLIVTETNTFLHEAIESECYEIVQLLLQNESLNINETQLQNNFYIDLNSTACFFYNKKYEKTVLHHAIKKGNINIIKLLLSNQKVDINLNSISRIDEGGGCIMGEKHCKTVKKSTFYFAIKFPNINLIKILLKQPNVDINFGMKEIYTNWEGKNKVIKEKSSLYLSVEKNNFEIVKHLLMAPEINVNFESISCSEYWKQTALCRAIQENNIEIVKILLSHPEIDVNKPAVFYAETIDAKYKENTEIDEKRSIIKTPLQIAYDCQNPEILQLLLKRNDIINHLNK